MYTQFRASNYRCFRDLSISPLARLNLIAGKNNVGKTTLLEALWLHHGSPNPELGFRVSEFRGISEHSADQPLYDLFHNLELDAKIELSSKDSNGTERSDSLYLREPTRVPMPSGKGSAIASSASSESLGKEIVIDYTDDFGKSGESVLSFRRNEMQLNAPLRPKRSTAVFLTDRRYGSREYTQVFSDVEIKGVKEKIIKLLQLIEPRLSDLTVIVRGLSVSVWADIGIGKLLPLQAMGGGTQRWFELALAFERAPNGVLLIDEIENGLHHSVMTDIWRNLEVLADEHNIQVFATTHSEECVRSALTAFKEYLFNDFRLHRLEAVKGSIKAITYDAKTLEAALDSGLEFR
jgi:AAA15 family ATPase/GTPase